MALENEARFHVPEDSLNRTLQELNTRRALTPFSLRWIGTKDHTDTYFDVEGALQKRGWSLRLRTSGDKVRATLKRPVVDPNASGQVIRDELENDSNESFLAVVLQIIAILRDDGIISGGLPSQVQTMLDGAYATLQSTGLRDLFAIRTTRHIWVVTSQSEDVAELVVDDSYYDIGPIGLSDPIRECRLEVELIDPSRGSMLAEICEELTAKYDVHEVYDSKFDRGMLHYATRALREKLETKISVRSDADYNAIIKHLEHNPEFLPTYRFTRLSERTITDAYFDTADQRLFQAGCYLRLRSERRNRELVFRHLTKELRYGEALQEEIVAKGAGDSFDRSWELIQNWLSSTTKLNFSNSGATLEGIEQALASIGFMRILDVGIKRVPWMVERVGSSQRHGIGQPDHVAKLKYDRIRYSRPGSQASALSTAEFEATGVEGEGSAASDSIITAYDAFVAQFMEACGHFVSDKNVTRRISAKYFTGMVELGIAHSTPEWLRDGRLSYRVSILRDTPSEEPEELARERDKLADEHRGAVERAKAVKAEVVELRADITSSKELADGSGREFLNTLDARLRNIESAVDRISPTINFYANQQVSQVASVRSDSFDMPSLALELGKMLAYIRQNPEDYGDIPQEEIVAAQEAARQNDVSSVVNHLKKVGKYVAELARQVAAPVASALIEAKLGIKS